uniref:peptide-methionine (S)-S-oxide reductase n=1 Tax=Fragaria ananassa TaxID=3747 RepID=Q9XFZ6_FRAAN|nr:peptide methionine sulfoxide reductase PMSR1 [Fragaria x ananassa]
MASSTTNPSSGPRFRHSGKPGSPVCSIRGGLLLGSRAQVSASRRRDQDRGSLLPGQRPRPELRASLHRNHQPLRGGSAPLRPASLLILRPTSRIWSRHDPTTLNRQGRYVGLNMDLGYITTLESRLVSRGIQGSNAKELKDKSVVTEILPAKRFYRSEEYHQQYLEKGGDHGNQSAEKGCTDPIRCYG